jgi:hypothetical protein
MKRCIDRLNDRWIDNIHREMKDRLLMDEWEVK